MPEFLLTPISLNNLACFILATTLTVYLIFLKQKVASSWFFILYIFIFSLFFLRNFLLFSLNYPGLIRPLLCGMIFTYIGLFMTVPWAYLSYKNIFFKESIVSITVCTILLIISCGTMINEAFTKPLLFRFTNHTHLVLTNPFIGVIPIIFLGLTISVFIRKQFKFNLVKENRIKMLFFPKGRVSTAFRNFTFFILFIIAASAFGILVFTGVLKSRIGLAVQLPLSLFSYFFITAAYLQSFPNETTFMAKMVGISLVLILIIVTHIGFVAISWQEQVYHNNKTKEINYIRKHLKQSEKNIPGNDNRSNSLIIPEDVQYIAKRPLSDGLFSNNYSVIHNKNKIVSSEVLNNRDKKNRAKLINKTINKILKGPIAGKPTNDELKKLAIEKINKKNYNKRLNNYKKRYFYSDVIDINTFFIYYYCIQSKYVYEIGYKYYNYRKEIHIITKNNFISILTAALSILIILPIFFYFSLVKRLSMLLKGLKKVDTGDLKVKIPVSVLDEIGFLANSFNHMVSSVNRAQSELKYYADNLEEIVEKRTIELQTTMEELEAVNESLISSRRIAETDLNIAINVQKSILPKAPPQLAGWDISFIFKPMSGVSGDFYDFYISDGKLAGINLSDVSGHGIASALITMIARTIFHRHFIENEDKDLNLIMEMINHDIIDEIDNVENFITSILLRFNKNTVEYVNAGHTDLLHKKSESGKVNIMSLTDKKIRGTFLGFNQFNKSYNGMKFELSKNDILLLYTDCLLESFNPKNEQYGLERLIYILEKAPNGSAKAVLDFIMNDFNNFMDNKNLNDDLTIISLKRKI